MFGENGMISEKQISLMSLLPVFTSSVLILPYLFARLFEENLIAGMILYVFVGFVYAAILITINCKVEYEELRITSVINLVRYELRLVLYILLCSAVIVEGRVPYTTVKEAGDVSNLAVLIPFLFVSLYACVHKVERQGRLCEIIFGSVMLPYITMLVLGIKNMDVIPFCNDFNTGTLLFKCVGLLSFITPIEHFGRLKERLNDKRNVGRKLLAKTFGVITFVTAGSYVLICIMGLATASLDPMMSISIMRYIELPFGVLQRLDVLMVWFFVTGCFGLVVGLLHRVNDTATSRCGRGGGFILTVVMLFSSVIIAYMIGDYKDALGHFLVYGLFVEVPLSIILPLINNNRFIKRIAMLGLVIALATNLTACGGRIENIEQRDYATVMVVNLTVDKITVGVAKEHRVGDAIGTETLYETTGVDKLYDSYADEKGKDLSMSHLKVIVVGDISEQEGRMDAGHFDGERKLVSLIDKLDSNMEIAKTCPVLMTEDADAVVEYMKKSDEPTATYIDNLIRTSEKKKHKIPRLMDYIKHIRDGKKIDMYSLAKDGNYLRLCEYDKNK
ncbi:MAG: hypothetical protein K6G76_02780 [Lachnospiraceae bacterium]|nr:hypothetical protein [Lachnospiraceae bacterium]